MAGTNIVPTTASGFSRVAGSGAYGLQKTCGKLRLKVFPYGRKIDELFQTISITGFCGVLQIVECPVWRQAIRRDTDEYRSRQSNQNPRSLFQCRPSYLSRLYD
jgi:hypothetical protein